MPPVVLVRRRRCRGFMPVARRATRAGVTPPTLRRSRRSSRSCATPGMECTVIACADWVVVLWRAGLRIHEALLLNEGDLDRRRGSLVVRRGMGGRRREVGMDEWAWERLEPWLDARAELPVGPLFCIVAGPIRGRAWTNTAVRSQLRRVAAQAGVRRRFAPPVRRRFAPHQLRHAHAVEMAREGVPLIVIQRQRAHEPRRDLDLLAGHRQRGDHRRRPRPTRTDDPRRRFATRLSFPSSSKAEAAPVRLTASVFGEAGECQTLVHRRPDRPTYSATS